MRRSATRWLLRYGALFAVVVSSGCDSQGHFVAQALDDRWTGRGFSAWASPPWIEAGFTPKNAELWRNSGFTVQQAASWHRVDESPAVARAWMREGFANSDDVLPWIQAFSDVGDHGARRSREAAKLRSAGISPGELKEFKKVGVYSSNADKLLKIKALVPEAGSIEKAAEYDKEGVKAGGVAAYKHAQEERAARFREAAKPCTSIESETSLLTASPYAIVGKCFRISPLWVTQWIDGETVLAISPWLPYLTTPFYVEAKNLSQTTVPSALVIGKEPFVYEAVSGASRTAFHIRILAWNSDLQ